MPDHVDVDIKPEPTAVAEARRVATRHLSAWDATVDHDVAILLLSEVVTNAIRHGAPPVRMRMSWDGTLLRVVVSDSQTELAPRLLPASVEADGGRGMHLLEALAARWGADVAAAEKVVWFELRG